MPPLKPATHAKKVKSNLSKGVNIVRLGVRHLGVRHSVSYPPDGPQLPVRLGIQHERVLRAKLGESRERWEEKRQEYAHDLAPSTRRALERVAQDSSYDSGGQQMDMDTNSWEDIVDPVDREGPNDNLDISHAGGEYTAIHEFRRRSRQQRRRKDNRTWAEMVHRREIRWAEQMPALVKAYLLQKHGTPVIEENDEKFTIDVVGIDTYRRDVLYNHIPGCSYLNVTLLHYGLLSPNPIEPTIAFTVQTLEMFRRLRLRSPHVSIQAWVHVLCDLHNVNYRRYLREQFTRTFDVYLAILRGVQANVDVALGRDIPDWRMKHTCPPCLYKLQNEAKLEPSIFIAIDGNNSLKRLARPDRQEVNKSYPSSYYLTSEEVDRFKDEVKKRVTKKGKDGADKDCLEDGEPVDGGSGPTTCTDRWKAANADTVKTSFKEFVETGIFLSACRHGLVLLLVDMLRSGELAKYPLAQLDKLLKIYGAELAIAYDIACAFASTVSNSSLGPRARQVRYVVPAFHGHAHNRACQLKWHPLYIKGFGIEDLEVCERVFKGSNALATVTRHATHFHRQQAIDMYFTQHDEDKYEMLSTFLYNNYVQALDLLRDMPIAIEAITCGRTIAGTTYHLWLDQEREYLASRQKEPEADIAKGDYVSLLIKMTTAKSTFDAACALTEPPNVIDRWSRMRRVTAVRQAAWEAYEYLLNEVMHAEDALDVTERWTPETPQWQEAAKYLQIRNYQLAVDKLEGLVVQRLFELTKANLSGTGFKLRVHISKSLQTQCSAIKTALKRYNTAAAILQPPHPRLDWQEIVEYGSLAEFELLRWAAREDIRKLPWADDVNRQATIYHLRIERAHEEIARLNVEVARLNTWITDEEAAFDQRITELQEHEPLLCNELRERRDRRKRVNDIHRCKLTKLFRLDGFTGSYEIGTHQGSFTIRVPATGESRPSGSSFADDPKDEDDGDEEDDEDADEMARLQRFIESIPTDEVAI